ncbi:unnamed protein product [Blepharisma stoltei]|uniref:RING-type domain-containing protein n=1 Tax=Blepharisma stoltei TaxID=1481888 RepID=A0AAU9JV37_9CILI|nr:unnamed protein product [Blepharisma stoltei]
MENYKKFPKAATKNLPPNYSEFSHLSLVSPPNQTFYLSFGISTLESLVRLNNSPVAKTSWKNLKFLNQKIQNKAKESGFENEFFIYENLISFLSSNDRFDGYDTLNVYMTENRQTSAKSLSMAIKCIFAYLCPETDVFNRRTNLSINEVMPFLHKFSEAVNIGIYIMAMTNHEFVLNKSMMPAPVSYLFYNSKAVQWGVLYHKDAAQLDSSPRDENFNFRSPFVHLPKIQFEKIKNNYKPPRPVILSSNTSKIEKRDQSVQTDDIFKQSVKVNISTQTTPKDLSHLNKVWDIVREMYSLSQIPNNITLELKASLEKISIEFEELQSEALFKLEERINIITGGGEKKSGCNHTDNEFLTPACGNRHCVPCLRDHIIFQKNTGVDKIKCFCNVEMSEADIATITKVRQSTKVHIWDRPNKVANQPTITVCQICKTPRKQMAYAEIRCQDHKVCVICHTENYRQGNGACPLKDREYSNEELRILQKYERDATRFD